MNKKKKEPERLRHQEVNNGWNFSSENKTISCTNWVWAYTVIHVSSNSVEQSGTLHTY